VYVTGGRIVGRRPGSIGWWATHDYHRRSMEVVDDFCGWDTLLRLVHRADDKMKKALIATLFETGGRANEVLSLRPTQFSDRGYYISVINMLVLKKRQKNRRTFPILKTDPLVPFMMDWVEYQREQNEPKLFPYKYDWLYKTVRKIDDDWFPHRFRAERATQLAIEHNFNTIDLQNWFGWARPDMPSEYAKKNVRVLAKKLRETA